jgi:hypothetical protein
MKLLTSENTRRADARTDGVESHERCVQASAWSAADADAPAWAKTQSRHNVNPSRCLHSSLAACFLFSVVESVQGALGRPHAATTRAAFR